MPKPKRVADFFAKDINELDEKIYSPYKPSIGHYDRYSIFSEEKLDPVRVKYISSPQYQADRLEYLKSIVPLDKLDQANDTPGRIDKYTSVSHHVWVTDMNNNPRDIVTYRSTVQQENKYTDDKTKISIDDPYNSFIRSIKNVDDGSIKANVPLSEGKWHHVIWTNFSREDLINHPELTSLRKICGIDPIPDEVRAAGFPEFTVININDVMDKDIGDIQNIAVATSSYNNANTWSWHAIPDGNSIIVDSNGSATTIAISHISNSVDMASMITQVATAIGENVNVTTTASAMNVLDGNGNIITSISFDANGDGIISQSDIVAAITQFAATLPTSSSGVTTALPQVIQDGLLDMKHDLLSVRNSIDDFVSQKMFASVSDVVRLAAVKDIGGMYFDVDYVLFDQEAVHTQQHKYNLFDIIKNYRYVVGKEIAQNGYFCNAFMSSATTIAPSAVKAWNTVVRNLNSATEPNYVKYSKDASSKILSQTGPVELTISCLDSLDDAHDIVLNFGCLLYTAVLHQPHTPATFGDVGALGYDMWGGTWVDNPILYVAYDEQDKPILFNELSGV